MEKEALKSALVGGRNLEIKKILSYMIDVSSSIENIDGNITMIVNLMACDKSDALGLAAWDNNENCNATVTHDISRLDIFNLGDLITKARIGK